MDWPQVAAGGVLILALVLFTLDRWRFDVVALFVLLLSVALGLVPMDRAFAGFGHPAVITVAAVLVISHALELSGMIHLLARRLLPAWRSTHGQILLYSGAGAALSAVMNNVGALAVTMPLAIAAARKAGTPPGRVLMPLAFATVLGGVITLIGTPPNLIVAKQREELTGQAFGLLDFAPVGLPVALAGLAFLALMGWRLIPQRAAKGSGQSIESAGNYVAEFTIVAPSPLAGAALPAAIAQLEQLDLSLVGVVRGKAWIPSYAQWFTLSEGDSVVVQGLPGVIAVMEGKLGLHLEGHDPSILQPAETDLRVVELVLTPRSPPVNSTAEELRLRGRYMVNLLAVARQGAQHFGPLRSFRFEAGDVLLLQGSPGQIQNVAASFAALPLAERALELTGGRAPWIAASVFAVALAAIGAGLAEPAVALMAAVFALVVSRVIRPRNLYGPIDWPVIVLLAAMMPVGDALATTGLSGRIADWLLLATADLAPLASLALLIVITMFLSDVLNNAVTVVVMGPIAATVADRLSLSPDPFLMGVAIGASCAFLTPIGHQNNTLVMGPGGYRFGDYWRVGLPLEAVCVAVALLLLPVFWPFSRG